MSKHYEIMDLTSGNLVGDYATEAEALEIIRRGVADHGVEAVCDLGLAEVEGDETHLIATCGELITLAASQRAAQPV